VTDPDSTPDSTGDSSEIATSTLAAIYEKQGLYERALSIWRRLARRSPEDPRIAERIEALSRRIETAREEGEAAEPGDEKPPAEPVPAPEPVPEEGEPTPADEPVPPVDPPPRPDEDERFLAWLEER